MTSKKLPTMFFGISTLQTIKFSQETKMIMKFPRDDFFVHMAPDYNIYAVNTEKHTLIVFLFLRQVPLLLHSLLPNNGRLKAYTCTYISKYIVNEVQHRWSTTKGINGRCIWNITISERGYTFICHFLHACVLFPIYSMGLKSFHIFLGRGVRGHI
jgi:hypothetical protein